MVTLSGDSPKSAYYQVYRLSVGNIFKIESDYETVMRRLNDFMPLWMTMEIVPITPGTTLYTMYGPDHMVIITKDQIQIDVYFKGILGSPYDNVALNDALEARVTQEQLEEVLSSLDLSEYAKVEWVQRNFAPMETTTTGQFPDQVIKRSMLLGNNRAISSTETIVGGVSTDGAIIIKSADNVIHDRGGINYPMYDSGNSNLSTIDWEMKNAVVAGNLTVAGIAKVANETIATQPWVESKIAANDIDNKAWTTTLINTTKANIETWTNTQIANSNTVQTAEIKEWSEEMFLKLSGGTVETLNVTGVTSVGSLLIGGKTAATQEFVTQQISAIDLDIFIIVTELPAKGLANKIYLVPLSPTQEQNEWIEYIWVNNKWELIGSLKVDLTGLASEEWVLSKDYVNSTQMASALSLKVDKTTKINSGEGLTGGGDLSVDRTISLEVSGVTPGAYPKVTVDVFGRVTSGSILAATDIPLLDAGKITSGIFDIARIPDLSSLYVSLTNNQSISGNKTFSGTTWFNNNASILQSRYLQGRLSAGTTYNLIGLASDSIEVGSVSYPMYIMSNASDLLHNRAGTNYAILDMYNYKSNIDLSDTYVTKGTAQDITGQKTFTAVINANGKIVLPNYVALWGKDTGNREIALAWVNSSDLTNFGSNDCAMLLNSSAANLIHNRAGAQYIIWDAANSNLSTVNWAAKDITAAGTLTVTGVSTLNGTLRIGGSYWNSADVSIDSAAGYPLWLYNAKGNGNARKYYINLAAASISLNAMNDANVWVRTLLNIQHDGAVGVSYGLSVGTTLSVTGTTTLTGMLNANGHITLPTGYAIYGKNSSGISKDVLLVTGNAAIIGHVDLTATIRTTEVDILHNRAGTAAYPILDTYNYNSYVPTLTGAGASGTWAITSTDSNRLGGYTQDKYYRTVRTTNVIGSSIPTTLELADAIHPGSHLVTFPGASGHLFTSNVDGGSTTYMQMYSMYNSGMYWRNSTNTALSTKPWRLIYDNVNSNLSTVDWTMKNATVAGTASITGNVGIGGLLNVEGALSVVGNTSLRILTATGLTLSGGATIDGSMLISGDLKVATSLVVNNRNILSELDALKVAAGI